MTDRLPLVQVGGQTEQLQSGDSMTATNVLSVSATDRLIGRDTAGAGLAEELTVSGGVEFSGVGGIRRSALTGDVLASAGSNTTTNRGQGIDYFVYYTAVTISSDQSPLSNGGNSMLLVTATGSSRNINGIAPSTSPYGSNGYGQILTIVNAGTQNLVFVSSAVGMGSSALFLPNNANITLIPGQVITFVKNATTDQWNLGAPIALAGTSLEVNASARLIRSALTGDVTATAGSNATTIAANAVTNAKAAQMVAHTFKGNNTGSTSNPLDVTLADLKTELSLTGTNSGDQTSIVGITGTKAQFDTACSDENFEADGQLPVYDTTIVRNQTIGSTQKLVTFGPITVTTGVITVNGPWTLLNDITGI